MIGASIWPTNTAHWESSGGDNTQHYIGWLAYRQDQWHWPLTYTNRINNPTGTSIVFTDSIPLVGVIFKIFNSILPESFQYFGVFILLSYILQYSFGFLLLKYFSPNSWLVNLLGSSFFLVSPIISKRVGGHESLTAHWLILASMYLYCQAINPVFKKWILPSFIFLVFISLGIHFYLATMVLAFGVFTLLEINLTKNSGLINTVKDIVFLLIIFGASVYLWGYLVGKGAGTAGIPWSLNLNSFINPQGKSNFLPSLPFHKPWQHEGFSYLGLGVFLLLPISIFISFRRLTLREFYRWIPLIILVSSFAIFALGKEVYWGDIVILKLPDFYIWRKARNILHATGRFVWPLYYTLLLWILCSVSKIKNRTFLIGLLVASIIIQISDISSLRSKSMLNPNQVAIFPQNYLEQINHIKKQTNSNYFLILPPYGCPGGLDYKDRSLLFAAVKSDLITNDSNTARLSKDFQKKCNLIQELQKINQLKEDTLYAINKNEASSSFLLDISKAENRDKCKALPKENWLLCNSQGWSSLTRE